MKIEDVRLGDHVILVKEYTCGDNAAGDLIATIGTCGIVREVLHDARWIPHQVLVEWDRLTDNGPESIGTERYVNFDCVAPVAPMPDLADLDAVCSWLEGSL